MLGSNEENSCYVMGGKLETHTESHAPTPHGVGVYAKENQWLPCNVAVSHSQLGPQEYELGGRELVDDRCVALTCARPVCDAPWRDGK